jgi:mannose-1-phosphate guanylyltransferase/mannose-6-phosphate isomerase
MLHAVILAGGGGTRLWPLSRTNYPKQFLKLLGEHTLLQQTILRLDGAITPQNIWVVTGQEQEPTVRTQLSALPHLAATHVLGEPSSRNTAAAIGLAAVYIRRVDPEAVMVVLPADHWILRTLDFILLLKDAVGLAQAGMLVTLGIVPDRPETGYGYIRRGASLNVELTGSLKEAYYATQFVEKPSLQLAQNYVDSREYYWNAGIFLWRVSRILEEIASCLPVLSQGLEDLAQHLDREEAPKVLRSLYSRLESISIDYGVIEKASRLAVVPADIGWSDLGEWSTIHRLSLQDERGNVLGANVIDVDSENSFVYGGRRTIATIGLKNTIVIDADDALLVCPADRAQDVRKVVQQLQGQGVESARFSRTEQRPWGMFTVLEEGPRFKVKRLVVFPGAALSLQLHRQRSEHWVVVAGVAQVTKGELEMRLETNQSTYIPAETKHQLANPERELLEIIEIQTGDYLGEDDIIRFVDLYQRVS